MPVPRPLPPPRLKVVPEGWSDPPEGWTPDNLGHCRSCLASVLWCFTPAGRKAPVNRDGTPHFATCPDGPSWRRKGARGAVTVRAVAPAPDATVSRPQRSGEGPR